MSAVTINFMQGDKLTAVTADIGKSLMEVAIENNIEEIAAECGGACVCATCHCMPDAAWSSKLPPVEETEGYMLEFNVEEPTQESRLSCQIPITQDLDGMIVKLPIS